MKRGGYVLAIGAIILGTATGRLLERVSAQPAPTQQPTTSNSVQESIERQLGGLIIANTQCSQQTLSLASQVRVLTKERDELRAKLDAKLDGKLDGTHKDNK